MAAEKVINQGLAEAEHVKIEGAAAFFGGVEPRHVTDETRD